MDYAVYSGQLRLPMYVYDELIEDAQSIGLTLSDYLSRLLVALVEDSHGYRV